MLRKIQIFLLAIVMILAATACNMPFLAADQPETTPAPTDAGFQLPTQPGETAQPPAETTPAAGEKPGEQTTPAEPGGGQGTDKRLTLASTDSLEKSGLLGLLVNTFMKNSNYEVLVETGGTGRGFRLAEKYVVDVLLVNDVGEELAFIKSGNGRDRAWIMHTDYVIAGPEDDPAGIKVAADAVDAFKKIAGSGAKFVTRGADSEVVTREKALWKKAGITPSGEWYVAATDAGMVGTMKLASDKKAYTLIDRATFLENQSKFKLALLFEGSEDLFNKYHAVTVNPDRSPKINYAAAQAFIQFLTSPQAQEIIAQHQASQFGQPIFFPDAGKPEE